jgi:diguanylate cyclase
MAGLLMAVPGMPQDDMRTALVELDQALYNHDQWCEALYGTLICRLAPDGRDIDSDAHRKCRFGQWLYGPGAARLDRRPGFAEAQAEHERMHRSAATLLLAGRNGVSVAMADFERFGTALKRMRLEVLTLKRELEDALYNLDPLTGTASRIGMLTKLREQQELVKRKVHNCAVAMMDLDHFKVVNDTYGHLVGDKVLATTARFASTHLRPYDRIFRYGGEEFLICLPDADLESGRGIIERIRVELASISHETAGKPPFSVTVSFGLTLLDPDAPVEESIDRADKALYSAKLSGRNCSALWAASMTASATGARAGD